MAYPDNFNFDYMPQQQPAWLQTAQIAQDRMMGHLQTTLSGTMQAGMVAYTRLNEVTSKAHERVYNDMLFNNGQYALERSFGRDVAWMTGLANTGFGRALQIGGRQPEFLTQQEYAYQMARSTHSRIFEMQNMGIRAGMSVAGMALGGPLGFVGGMAVGWAADQVSDAILARRKHVHDVQMFTDVTDANQGAGQRRISEGVSNRLANNLFDVDRMWAKDIPLIGERLMPNTSRTETFKKMMTQGLFRDVNLNDLDTIQKEIEKGVKFMEKFSGILHMTKDEVLKMKSTFNERGMNEAQQTSAMNMLGFTSKATGIHASQLYGLYNQMDQTAFRMGFNATDTANMGMNEIAIANALRESKIIDRRYNPVEFAMQNMQFRMNYSGDRSGLGRGLGVPGAVNAFEKFGGGDKYLGAILYEYGLVDKTDVTDKAYKNIYNRYGLKGVLADIARRGGGREQMIDAIMKLGGLDKHGAQQAQIMAARKWADDTGTGAALAVFKMSDVLTEDGKGLTDAVKSAKKFNNLNESEREKISQLKFLRDKASYSTELTGNLKDIADKLYRSGANTSQYNHFTMNTVGDIQEQYNGLVEYLQKEHGISKSQAEDVANNYIGKLNNNARKNNQDYDSQIGTLVLKGGDLRGWANPNAKHIQLYKNNSSTAFSKTMRGMYNDKFVDRMRKYIQNKGDFDFDALTPEERKKLNLDNFDLSDAEDRNTYERYQNIFKGFLADKFKSTDIAASAGFENYVRAKAKAENADVDATREKITKSLLTTKSLTKKLEAGQNLTDKERKELANSFGYLDGKTDTTAFERLLSENNDVSRNMAIKTINESQFAQLDKMEQEHAQVDEAKAAQERHDKALDNLATACKVIAETVSGKSIDVNKQPVKKS